MPFIFFSGAFLSSLISRLIRQRKISNASRGCLLHLSIISALVTFVLFCSAPASFVFAPFGVCLFSHRIGRRVSSCIPCLRIFTFRAGFWPACGGFISRLKGGLRAPAPAEGIKVQFNN